MFNDDLGKQYTCSLSSYLNFSCLGGRRKSNNSNPLPAVTENVTGTSVVESTELSKFFNHCITAEFTSHHQGWLHDTGLSSMIGPRM